MNPQQSPTPIPSGDRAEAGAPWQARAACADSDPRLFDTDDDVDAGGPGGVSLVLAKRVCSGCPVRRDCLDEALRDDVDTGVWGGLSPAERRAEAALARRGRGRPSAAESARARTEARRLRAAGAAPAQIAARLGATERSVRRWLSAG